MHFARVALLRQVEREVEEGDAHHDDVGGTDVFFGAVGDAEAARRLLESTEPVPEEMTVREGVEAFGVWGSGGEEGEG